MGSLWLVLGWLLGFVWFLDFCAGDVFAILAEVHEGVAELAVERDLIAADEFDARDVVAIGWGAGSLGVGFSASGF